MSLGARVVRVLRLLPAGALVPGGAGGAGVGVRARAGDDLRHVRQPSVPFLSDAWPGCACGLLPAVVRVRRHVLAPCHAGADPVSHRARGPRGSSATHIAFGLAANPHRSVWDIKPATLTTDKSEPAGCGGEGRPCERIALIEGVSEPARGEPAPPGRARILPGVPGRTC